MKPVPASASSAETSQRPGGLRRRLSSAPAAARSWARQGLKRMRGGFLPAIQMTLCAVSSFFFASLVLGHHDPLFAATSALISLGFGVESHISRVIEVAAGCTLGILIGDLLLHTFGSGVWQAALVLFVSIMLARFLDPSSVLTTQMGLQSLLVVLIPVPAGGPIDRSIDAVVGGVFALVIVALWPQDPRRESHSQVRDSFNEFAGIIRECAGALAYSDSTMAWHALVRARTFQPKLDKISKSLSHAGEVSRISPLYRGHRDEITKLNESMKSFDLAVRNLRVFARRLSSVINNTAMSAEAQGEISHLLELTAEGAEALALALGEADAGTRDWQRRRARLALNDVASALSPEALGVETVEGKTLVLIFRPLVVDLLEASGLSHKKSRQHLPELSIPDDDVA